MSSFSIKWILAASAALVTVAAIRYVTRHQFPIGYDETMYVNQVLFDREVLVDQGPLVFARKQVGTETWRPPGYRLAAAPVALIARTETTTLRALSLASLVVTALLLFGAGHELAGVSAGLAWSLAVGCANGSLYSELLFGTEVTLFPAIALGLYGMARVFQREETDRVAGLALFFSAAIGGLSKLSFFVVFLPFMGMAWWLARGQRLRVAAAAGAGLLVISPWWFFNWRDALDYARYASGFQRHEFPWFTSAVRHLLGIPFAVGLAVAIGWLIVRTRRGGLGATLPVRKMIVACLAGTIPLLFLHIMGRNHNMRLLAPAWILGAGIAALLLHASGAFARPAGKFIGALTLAAQALVLSITTWFSAQPQRDWSPLRARLGDMPPRDIRIAHLGNAGGLNSPQILHAWRRHGETIRLDRLWRWETGEIRWGRVLAHVDSADMVVIPLGITTAVDDVLGNDNANNLGLIDSLRARPDAWVIDTLPRTRTDSVAFLVFTRRRS